MRRILPLLVLVTASACGGDTDPSTAPSPTPSAIDASPTATPPEIKVADFSFSPRSLTVPSGTTVKVTSTGQRPHTWTRKPDFDIALNERGATGSFMFVKPGTYEYVCTIHEAQGMTGVVVVT